MAESSSASRLASSSGSDSVSARPRSLRKCRHTDYKELNDVKLPRAKRVKHGEANSGRLYPIEIVEEENNRCKVHYIGYASSYDEWKTCEELVRIDSSSETSTSDDMSSSNCILEQFSLYKELSHRIKASLKNVRKESPAVKIEMPFDFITFCGGLQQCGVKKHFRGSQRYTISSYKTLDHLLGSNWHVCGCNQNGDYCYATLNTVEFYLYRRHPLIDAYRIHSFIK